VNSETLFSLFLVVVIGLALPTYVGLLSATASAAYFREKFRFHSNLARAHGARGDDNGERE
jgi:hypothetical protein